MILEGTAWKFGDDIGATALVSSRYDKEGMGRQWDECAKHVLEDKDAGFAAKVKKGDILTTGENLGMGHAHYYMAAIKGSEAAGLSALLGESVNVLFQREAIDAGVPCWSFKGLADMVETGNELRINLATGEAVNLTTGEKRQFEPVSPIVLDILGAGGSRNWAMMRIGRNDLTRRTSDQDGAQQKANPA